VKQASYIFMPVTSHDSAPKSWTRMPPSDYGTQLTQLVVQDVMTFGWPLKHLLICVYPCFQFGVKNWHTSRFILTQDDSFSRIFLDCCVIFKRNYRLLLELSDSHVVPSISNNYSDVGTGVQVQLPHIIIVSPLVHTLHITIGNYTIFMPRTIKVARFQI
jgi:hypothetical protein